MTELLPPTETEPPMRARSRFSGPQLRTLTDTASRHASNLELFFDLVLAVAVGALGQALATNPTAAGFLHFGFLFVPVWWAWVGCTFYADRFESDDIVYRLLVLTAMAAIVGVAVNTGDAFASTTASLRLAGSYVAVRVVLVVMYLRAFRQEPVGRPLCARYAIGFGLGAATWLASCFVSPPGRFWLWGAGLAVELATPLVSASAISRVPFHPSHIPERFGSFTIVVLGEAVFFTATGVGSTLHVAGIVIAVTGFLMAAIEWWIYFEFVDASPLRRGLIAGQTYIYGHLFIFMGITATGAGVLLAIRDASGHSLPEGVRGALCGGVAAFVLAIGIIQLVNTRSVRDVAVVARLVIGALCLGLLVAPFRLAPAAISAALVVLLVAQVLVEAGRRPVRPVSALRPTAAAPG